MKVLLVDDHPLILAALTAMMEQMNPDVTVTGAATAADARAALARDDGFDLALLDLQLESEDDGFQLLGDVRQFHAQMPVVVNRLDVSDLFKDGAMVVVEGKMGPDGIFQADQLLAKCPTKYEAAEEKNKTASAQ